MTTTLSRPSAGDRLANLLNPHAPQFSKTLCQHGKTLRRSTPQVLQLNLGKLCNLTCIHCHVNAGPGRKEIVRRDTLERIVEWLAANSVPTVDLTGGAPEMVPDFRWLVARARELGSHVIDRCNLTILVEPGYEDLAAFLAAHRVEIIASMPCYSPENVNEQRGDGVFDDSIRGLHLLNELGYGIRPELPLNLVYNPNGPKLPPAQDELEADYKRELRKHFGIEFNHLYTITNLPVARFAAWLKRNGHLVDYMKLLVDNFNPAAVEGLMCRDTISVDWQGNVFDCDFNQQIDLHLGAGESPLKLWDLDLETWKGIPIRTAAHCYGCTAGNGSSCGGAVV